MTRSSVGVVVINWNGLADTLACLESLVAADLAPARIVVVDNGSSDGSIDALFKWRARRPTAAPMAIIALPVNRGFSAANNIGVEYLHADPAVAQFLLLNNDATVDRGFFTEIARALNVFPDAGLVGPTIFVTGRPGEVWYAGGHFVPFRSLNVHDTVVPREPTPVPTEFVTGCALLISRRAWRTLGPLPECYFPIYFEDTEYSFRAGQAGLRVLYAPRAIVHHAIGATTSRVARPHVEHLKARNRALFVRRNFRGWSRWGALAYLLVTKPGRAVWEAFRGRPALGWAIFRGTLEGMFAPHRGETPRPSLDGVRVHA